MKTAKNLSIGTIAALGATLYLLTDPKELYQIIADITNGGIATLALKNIFNYTINKQTIKGKDCYFLWLLHR